MKNYFTQNTWSPLEKHRARGQPHGHANCVVRQGPGLMLCSHHFENLNTFMCECLCHKRSPVVQWSYTQAEEAVCVSFLPCHPVCTVSMMPHKLRILVDLWRIGTQRVTKWVQGKHITSMTDLEVVTAPRGYAFHLNQDLLQKEQKEGNGSLRNTSDQRTPSYPFLLVGVTSRYDDFHYKW